eukprot:scaffold205339_cov26-Tisochrysis_lutea.AAC.2
MPTHLHDQKGEDKWEIRGHDDRIELKEDGPKDHVAVRVGLGWRAGRGLRGGERRRQEPLLEGLVTKREGCARRRLAVARGSRWIALLPAPQSYRRVTGAGSAHLPAVEKADEQDPKDEVDEARRHTWGDGCVGIEEVAPGGGARDDANEVYVQARGQGKW